MQIKLLSRFIPLCIIHSEIDNKWPFLATPKLCCRFSPDWDKLWHVYRICTVLTTRKTLDKKVNCTELVLTISWSVKVILKFRLSDIFSTLKIDHCNCFLIPCLTFIIYVKTFCHEIMNTFYTNTLWFVRPCTLLLWLSVELITAGCIDVV